jgi:hypothetical protein
MNAVAALVFPLAHWRDACTFEERESRPDLFLASLTAACVYNCWFFRWNGKGLHGKNLLARRFNPGPVTQPTSPALPLFVTCSVILYLCL